MNGKHLNLRKELLWSSSFALLPKDWVIM